MRITIRLTSLLVWFLMVSCAWGQDIHYNYDRGTDFQSYRTYQWVNLPSTPPRSSIPSVLPSAPGGLPDIRSDVSEDQLLDQDIKRAIDEQLALKGLIKVENNANIQMRYQAAIHEEKGINLWGTGGPGWWGAGPVLSGFNSVQGQTSTIPVGTLVVVLYDPARKQLIWRGDASKTVDLKKDPNKNYRALQKAIAKLFKNYPPQPSK